MFSSIYMTSISCKSRDLYKNRIVRTKIEKPLVQGHPVVFGLNICYLFYQKSGGNVNIYDFNN